MAHQWGSSKVGHGESQCLRCGITNREAWVLGDKCIEPVTGFDEDHSPVDTRTSGSVKRSHRAEGRNWID